MAALSRRLRPLRCVLALAALFCARFYGCPFLRLRPLRGPRVHERVPCCARCVYGVRWRLSRFFRLLLECLCGASLFLRASSEQLLTSPESNYLLQKNSTKPTNT